MGIQGSHLHFLMHELKPKVLTHIYKMLNLQEQDLWFLITILKILNLQKQDLWFLITIF